MPPKVLWLARALEEIEAQREVRLPKPRVVLCHGVFDGLHSGHLRHFQDAKQQGEILVVSVTADAYVRKGPGRPYVPEDLRAETVAALEIVDYVVITPRDSAANVINVLQPDVFAKGQDYADLHDSRTGDELAALHAYGGQMVFTPGEVVFSSTVLGAPQVTLPDFSGLRVHVIGDAIRDVYTHAKCLGAASKSPTLVYELLEQQEWIGGAGVVAAHCEAAGAQVTLTTAGETRKERILVEGVKVSEFHRRSAVEAIGPGRLSEWAMQESDVVILADFQHGMFTASSIEAWLMAARDAGVVAAETQTTDIAWGNILEFRGCDLLFANEREARFALRDRTSSIEAIAYALWEKASAPIFLKLGARGLTMVDKGQGRDLPAYATQPIVDPIGAGDALLAYATLTYAATKDLELAGTIGSLAAAEACAHEGNVPVTLEAVRRRAINLTWSGDNP